MRSLEEHISPNELAGLPRSPEALASGAPDQQQLAQHLQQCEECADLAQTHWILQDAGRAVRIAETSECAPEQVWLEFAAGLRDDEGTKLREHAASCRRCTDALREAMELVGTDQIDEAIELPTELASSTPAWQRRVAAQMVSITKANAPKRRWLGFPFRFTLALPVAAAVLLVVGLGGMAWWHNTHPSDNRLLAEAYNKRRTLEVRIPGAEPVPLYSFTRGETDALSDPTELLELRLRAQQHLDRVPKSPYWHQILGEVQLQQLNPYDARRNFEIAQTFGEKLPNLTIDLAAALFEIGVKSGSAESFAEATELYSRQLNSIDTSKNQALASLLYYNRALCWERQSLTENALDDLRSALRLEPSAAWRKEIEAEIARISSRSSAGSPDGYETALDEATAKLLPLWLSSPEAHSKISQIAALGCSIRITGSLHG